MTNAVGYVRVSTESQLDGFGLDIQEAAVRALAAELDVTLIDVFSDLGVSGSEDVAGRGALTMALACLEDGDATLLIVPKLDRLARDLLVQEGILRDVWATGAEVMPCAEGERMACVPDSPDDPSRRLIRQMLGAVAEYERAMIRARMVAGRRRKIAETGYAGGPEPFGHTDPDELEVLRDASERRGEGFTWTDIAMWLNGDQRFKRNGTPWDASAVHRTVTRAWKRGAVLPPVGPMMEGLF